MTCNPFTELPSFILQKAKLELDVLTVLTQPEILIFSSKLTFTNCCTIFIYDN